MTAGEKRLSGSSAVVVLSELSISRPLWVEPDPEGITTEVSGISLTVVSPACVSSVSVLSRCPSTTSFKAVEVGGTVSVVADGLMD